MLLLPLSWLYTLVTIFQKKMYQYGLKKIYRAPRPVMVIGNIQTGGTGKTPLIATLSRYLFERYGLKIGIVSRGYGGSGPFPVEVYCTSDPAQVGDEPALLAQELASLGRVHIAVAPKRQAAIELLLQQYPDLDLILSDDGLQHWAMARDIEWIVIDAQRGLGSGWLLPAGGLRESVKRLQGATVIWHGDANKPLHMQLKSDELRPFTLQNNVKPVATTQVWAIAGIGHPARFFNSVRQLGFEVIEQSFPDHYAYTAKDFIKFQHDPLSLPMITTAKDAVKWHMLMPPDLQQRTWILPVTAELCPSCWDVLHAQLRQLNLVD